MSFPVIPTYEELKEMSTTHTVDMVADKYNVTERAAYHWFEKNGLKPLPRPRGGDKKNKLDFEYIKKSIQQGVSLGEIAEMLHVCKATVSNRIRKEGTSYKEILMGADPLCKTGHNCSPIPGRKHDCMYWHSSVGCCDYIEVTGKRRPCPPNACTVYKKGRHPKPCELDRENKDMIF